MFAPKIWKRSFIGKIEKWREGENEKKKEGEVEETIRENQIDDTWRLRRWGRNFEVKVIEFWET